MQSNVASQRLIKILNICERSQIFSLKTNSLSPNSAKLQYGSLGSLLKKNIFNTWLSEFLKSNEIGIYPFEILSPRSTLFSAQQDTTKRSNSLLKSMIDSYYDILSIRHSDLPFGFAVYGPCVQDNTLEKILSDDEYQSVFSNLEAWTRLSVIFFYPNKKPMNWFYYWSKHRYLWWRKYSSVPSQFSLSDISRTSGDHALSIRLELPWGRDHLETVTLLGDASVEESFRARGGGGPSPLPTVVTCELELDVAVWAYLANSFDEKWSEGEDKNVFHLHNKLAPYKVCLCLEHADDSKKLTNVTKHLLDDLRRAGVEVFPTSLTHPCSDLCADFDRFDEMGIPYVIVLNESSLQTGIAFLRNRDTTLQEQIHVTELSTKLAKYLKL